MDNESWFLNHAKCDAMKRDLYTFYSFMNCATHLIFIVRGKLPLAKETVRIVIL